ncbi:YerC/YecD family TrpR-related protein [Wukongibacter baidiensis]|uniref:YerC/YecD family TrpR-related protein n=1 Tax=Wukongibacter baidiensis TaxID=1723361 RepID=UPI003D7F2676
MTYNSKLTSEFLDELFDAILLVKNREECYRFFEDVCTIKELQAISQRLQVAKLLRANKTYHEIEEITGASTATISRVNRCILYGADGYNVILDRIDEAEGNNKDNAKEE